jgi:hypothetical protein
MFDLDAISLVVVISAILTPLILAPALFVRAVVRWVNRRDDPRHARRPPDAA